MEEKKLTVSFEFSLDGPAADETRNESENVSMNDSCPGYLVDVLVSIDSGYQRR